MNSLLLRACGCWASWISTAGDEKLVEHDFSFSLSIFHSQGQYSLARAQQSFKSLVQIHEKNGWFTPPKEDG